MASAKLKAATSADGARGTQRAAGNVGHMDLYDIDANTPLSASREQTVSRMLTLAMTLLDDQQEEEAVQVEVDGAGLLAKEVGDQEEVAIMGKATDSGRVPRVEAGKVNGQEETSLIGTTIAIQAIRGEST
jgi:hypothetical protein